MALDLIFPLSDGGRRSGLDLKKTRKNRSDPNTFKKDVILEIKLTFSILLRSFGFRGFLGCGAPPSSSLSSPLPLVGLHETFIQSFLWASFSSQTIQLQPTHLLFFLRAFFSPSSPSSCSLPLPPFLFFFFNGSSSSESSLTKSSISPPFLRLKMQNKSHHLCCLHSNI